MGKTVFVSIPVVSAIGVALLTAAPRHAAMGPVSVPSAPPVAPVKIVTDIYFGVTVPDPYRYMENLNDPQVEAWFKAQNDYTRAVLARIPGSAR
jgi:prolyl oligopeptidase